MESEKEFVNKCGKERDGHARSEQGDGKKGVSRGTGLGD